MKHRITTDTLLSSGRRSVQLLVTAILLCFSILQASGFDKSIYASSSRLSSGRWARVDVATTGMQFISNAQLQNLGFADPQKVNVYGFGGRMIDEVLSADMPDDLPILPCVRTSRGILFFGTDNVAWSAAGTTSAMTWQHQSHPYDTHSYYFLSDRGDEEFKLPETDGRPLAGAEELTDFTCRTVHEQDMAAPSNTGRTLLGEDFRSPNTRNFTMTLPDIVGSKAMTRVNFAGLSTGGWSVTMKSNFGSKENATASKAESSSEFMQPVSLEKELSTDGEKYSIDITYHGNGTTRLARLDYIEVEWTRALKLRSGQLHIYDDLTADRNYTVAGCGSQTVVWDVTDPTAPLLVKHTLEGDKVRFSASGSREFIVFNPESGYTVESAGRVSNQDIHALETPDMLIISPAEYMEPSRRVAAIHESEGMKVHVLTPEAIYNEFSSGTADVSAFRKLLKMWQDRAGDPDRISYCLIMSRPSYDNKGVTEAGRLRKYPVVPIWQSPTGNTQSSSYSTDDFIGMIDDPGDRNSMDRNRISVAVGRFPVTSLQEANQAVTKLENYVRNSDQGSWRNTVLLLADDGDNSDHLDQTEKALAELKKGERGRHMDYDRIYLDTYQLEYTGTGKAYPQAKKNMLSKIDEGVLLWTYVGHANPVYWGHENILPYNDMLGMSNTRLPALYAATCEYARWDDDAVSAGEEMWLKEQGGVVAMVCPSRTVYISYNGPLTRSMGKFALSTGSDGKMMRFGEALVRAKRDYMPSSTTNNLRYCYLGDPALRLLAAEQNVALDKIADTDMASVANQADSPVIKARQRVPLSGRVTDSEGNVLTDFNGRIDILLMDAEKPVTTFGNNASDNSSRPTYTFNDRSTRLYKGTTVVKAGEWSTTMLMPSEIENNYSPARLTFYAYSDDGATASGSSEMLYVYGYDSDLPADTEGPEITLLALNRGDFKDGDQTHTTPVVLASFTDESGINLSDAGIGHKMMISLDGKKHFDDVNLYYTPDPFDVCSGSVAYPLPELEPGNHTLKISVFDNANNASSRELNFNVSATRQPSIYTVSTDCNPAKTSVKFFIATDRPMSKLDTTLEVFDLNGRRIWSKSVNADTGLNSNIQMEWNLCGNDGTRVARGIYLYRATIRSDQGAETTKTSKLAVSAP